MRTRILICIFILSSLLCGGAAAKEKSEGAAKHRDNSWNQTESQTFYGLSLYGDIYGPVTSTFMGDRVDFSAGIDVDFIHMFLPTFEMGFARWDGTGDYHSYTEMDEDYSYTCRGTYYKVGLKVNMLKKDREKKFMPMLYLTAKYCFTPSHFKLEGARLENEVWGVDKRIDADGYGYVQWAEFGVGIRVGVARYFFMGLEGNLKEFATKKAKQVTLADGTKFDMHHGYAPGYGDLNGSSWGVKYSLGWFFAMCGRSGKASAKAKVKAKSGDVKEGSGDVKEGGAEKSVAQKEGKDEGKDAEKAEK